MDVVFLSNVTETSLPITENISVVVDVEAFDFTYDEETVLFAKRTVNNQHIQRNFLNSSQTITLMTYMKDIISLEYDWVGKNLYWSTSTFVEVSDIHGQHRNVLYWDSMNLTRIMVLDPNKGYVLYISTFHFTIYFSFISTVKSAYKGHSRARVKVALRQVGLYL